MWGGVFDIRMYGGNAGKVPEKVVESTLRRFEAHLDTFRDLSWFAPCLR